MSTSAQTALRQKLSAGGVVQLSCLLPNLGPTLCASEVAEDFEIPVSTLRYWKKTGRVIAFRAPQTTNDLFPVIQFSGKTVVPWAEHVIKAVSDDVAEQITMSAERLVSE